MRIIPIKSDESGMKRTCNGCTKCCEGWLNGNAHGYHFYRGRKCFFLAEKNCSIYDDRPEDPCKTYQCAWLLDDKIPYWMKPNLVDVIITYRQAKDISYVELTEAGSKLNVEVFSWFVQEYVKGTWNTITYTIENNLNYISRDGEWEKICG
ncbi:MAG: hypothetical protein EB127_16065 [Alphaproteobacteria bacterium]|nr:hypothetical protein [Alphaproteobacteria bacterium]